ncbi:hypothetical protein RCL1_006792 [Eukaryota sp. TZLM3-RCL]
MDDNKLSYQIKNTCKVYANWPASGVVFVDLWPVLLCPQLVEVIVSQMAQLVNTFQDLGSCRVTHVVALESRGFIFGSMLSYALKLPFVPIRKPGKLPGTCTSMEIRTEYSSTSLEIQLNSLPANAVVILVDDLLATGGTLLGAYQLLKDIGAKLAGTIVVAELTHLCPNVRTLMDCPVHSLCQFDEELLR